MFLFDSYGPKSHARKSQAKNTMGKLNKKKKNKEADFVKPKLKVGKKKPNAANATNIAFKSSAINVFNQLEEKSEPTNRRNLGLKDLLHQLSHYNDNTRQDATQALKDFLTQYPTLMHQELSTVLQKLLTKSVDVHFSVRKGFLACMGHILKAVSNNEIQPFFPIIMAHMNCAMTHINEEIQADGVEFMDLCLSLFPDLFLKNCSKVLHSFLDLVSQKQNQVSGKKGNTKGISQLVSRDLSTRPSGKMSTMKARINVLEKLHKIVSIVFLRIESTVDEESKEESINFKDVRSQSLLLLKYELLEVNGQDFAGRMIANETIDDLSDCMKTIRRLIMSFMPVLFCCWNDYNPLKQTGSSSDKTNEETLSTLFTIIMIMKGISSATDNDKVQDFGKLFFDDFMKNIMDDFPLTFQNLLPIKDSKQDCKQLTSKINFGVSEVFCRILAQSKPAFIFKYLNYLEKVANYIQSTIASFGPKTLLSDIDSVQEVLQFLIKACFIVVKEEQNGKDSLILEPICTTIKDLTLIYKQSKTAATKCKLLSLLENLFQLSEALPEVGAKDRLRKCFEDWLSLLPNDLAFAEPDDKSMVQQVVSLICAIIIQNRAPPNLNADLSKAICHVLGSSRSIFKLSPKDIILQRRFLEMTYHLRFINKELVEKLVYLCHHEDIVYEVKGYVCHVLWCCFEKKKSISTELLLSFFLSVLLGSSMANLEKLQLSDLKIEWRGVERLKYLPYYPNEKNETAKVNSLAKDHMRLCMHISDMIDLMDFGNRVFEIFLMPVYQLLVKFKILPEVTIIGLLVLFTRFGDCNNLNPEGEYKELFGAMSELLFSIVIFQSHQQYISSSTLYSDVFPLASKVLDSNYSFLVRFIENASAEMYKRIIEDEVIARGLWRLRRQQNLQVKVNKILDNDVFQKLQTLLNKNPLYIL